MCFTVLYTSLVLTVWYQNLNGSHIKADIYIYIYIYMTFCFLSAHVLHVYITFGAKAVNVDVLHFKMCCYKANHITSIKMQSHN